MKIETYERRPNHVDAIKVTWENMHDVAKWCSGEVVDGDLETGVSTHILMPEYNGRKRGGDTRLRAFVGDWVLKSQAIPGRPQAHEAQFKVFFDRGFRMAFQKSVPVEEAPKQEELPKKEEPRERAAEIRVHGDAGEVLRKIYAAGNK